MTGEAARMVAFRLTPEAIVQLEAIATALGCSKTTVIERLLGRSTAHSIAAPDADVQVLRLQLETSQRSRMRLAAELAEAREREWAQREEIAALAAQRASAGPTWAHGVLHLSDDSTADDVVRAFRELSKRYHPDANPGDPRAARLFRDLVQARDRLLAPPV